jgi:DnaJ-class molecular chaperone
MAGCFKEVTCIDGTKIPITLRAGTQSGAEFACGGRGFRELNTGRTGSLFVIVEVDIPAVTNVNLKQELESLLTRIKLSN